MKTKNVILLSLLLSTVTVFAVEPKTEKKMEKNSKPMHHSKKGTHSSAYDRETEKGQKVKKEADLSKEEAKGKAAVGEESAMDKQKTKNSKKPAEL
jgi:hypothetical protein